MHDLLYCGFCQQMWKRHFDLYQWAKKKNHVSQDQVVSQIKNEYSRADTKRLAYLFASALLHSFLICCHSSLCISIFTILKIQTVHLVIHHLKSGIKFLSHCVNLDLMTDSLKLCRSHNLSGSCSPLDYKMVLLFPDRPISINVFVSSYDGATKSLNCSDVVVSFLVDFNCGGPPAPHAHFRCQQKLQLPYSRSCWKVMERTNMLWLTQCTQRVIWQLWLVHDRLQKVDICCWCVTCVL